MRGADSDKKINPDTSHMSARYSLHSSTQDVPGEFTKSNTVQKAGNQPSAPLLPFLTSFSFQLHDCKRLPAAEGGAVDQEREP